MSRRKLPVVVVCTGFPWLYGARNVAGAFMMDVRSAAVRGMVDIQDSGG